MAGIWSRNFGLRLKSTTTAIVDQHSIHYQSPFQSAAATTKKIPSQFHLTTSSRKSFCLSAAAAATRSSTDHNMTMEKPASLRKKLQVPHKLLLGPGPSNSPKRVLDAMQQPLLGYLHKEYLEVMKETSEGLRYLFRTKNEVTFAISGTGHAGMEASLGNLLEPGELVLICEAGLWGQRAENISHRYGLQTAKIVNPLGVAFTFEQIEAGLAEHKPKALFIVQGESSTGTLQPLAGLGQLCHKHDCLLIVDTVASLGATPFQMDQWEVDCVYSANQKALSVPPGLAPISFSQRAWAKVKGRKEPVRSFYLNLADVANYWGCDADPPRYHHTGMISLTYALREALCMLVEEGLEESIQRHQSNALKLHQGLAELGLELFVPDPAHRLPTLTTVNVPKAVDWKAVADYLMDKHLIEIAGGLGATAGKIWRIGLMGHNSKAENVERALSALKEALDVQGYKK